MRHAKIAISQRLLGTEEIIQVEDGRLREVHWRRRVTGSRSSSRRASPIGIVAIARPG
jgi:hypothetical protein